MISLSKSYFALLAISCCLMAPTVASAAGLNVVALGASNTRGKGQPLSKAYPAQLQSMLRSRGINAHVRNAGRNGKPTRWMLRQAKAIPSGTNVVILQPGSNDKRLGISSSQRSTNIRKIIGLLNRRGIKVIMLKNRTIGQFKRSHGTTDGSHLTAAGYRAMASELLSRVMAAR